MNAHTIPVRIPLDGPPETIDGFETGNTVAPNADPFAEWDREEAAQPTQAERLARVQAFAAECDRAYEARAPQREREAIRRQAIADEQFAQLSRQFCKMVGIEEPKVLRGRS